MVTTFNGKDCQVEIYVDNTTAGAAPGDWATVDDILAVGTGVDINTSKTVTVHHGLNHATPQAIKEGNITYDFSIDALYTTKEYGESTSATDLYDLINESIAFAMKLTVMSDADVEVMSVVMTYCRCSSDNLSVSDDGDLTASISGQGISRVVAVA